MKIIDEKLKTCEYFLQTLPKKIPIKKIIENFTFTSKRIESFKNDLSIISEEHQENFSIILVGSYGRLESSKQSDLDYCIVYNDNINDKDKITIKNNIQTTFQQNFDKKISLFLDLHFSEIFLSKKKISL